MKLLSVMFLFLIPLVHAQECTGDFNNDGILNVADLALFGSIYYTEAVCGDGICENGENCPADCNQAPTANAGTDQTILLQNQATLAGAASDDGLPVNQLTTMWSKLTGPGTVTFVDASSLSTQASFSSIGTYTLRLTADDTELTATDDVVITVNEQTTGVSFTQAPDDYQLYPRDENNKALIPITGTTDAEEMIAELYREGVLIDTLTQTITDGTFSLQPEITAELAEYSLMIYSKTGTTTTLEVQADNIVAGDAILIYGQSNAIYGYGYYDYSSQFARSFGVGGTYPVDIESSTWGLSTAEYDASNSGEHHVGVLGMYLQEKILSEGIPTVVINGGIGGTPIDSLLRNDADPADVDTAYGSLLARAAAAGVKDSVKMILFHQGESDSYDSLYDSYASKFADLHSDLNEDYPSLDRFYVYQLHPNDCDSGMTRQQEIRETQRTFETYSDVHTIATAGARSPKNCHFWSDGYLDMIDWTYPLIQKHFYGYAQGEGTPTIQQAYYSSANEITLTFDQSMTWQDSQEEDGTTYYLKDYFYLDNGDVTSGAASGTSVILQVTSSSATTITYLPNRYYEDNSGIYEGPWLWAESGAGVLSFYEYPIS